MGGGGGYIRKFRIEGDKSRKHPHPCWYFDYIFMEVPDYSDWVLAECSVKHHSLGLFVVVPSYSHWEHIGLLEVNMTYQPKNKCTDIMHLTCIHLYFCVD